ncbi:uncharacterized protein M6B38_338945 [Iris pallida]|uniref:Uncharacterized protein n=1 Tax=Iris pallida TaxID=29817 RepID=A0AAX6GZ48_IRIPA|nr:uncharacterized protein M6B38_338945 [Iris pallida]
MDSRNKRTRNDDDDGVEESVDWPDVKRIREDLFGILESEPDKDGSDPDPATDDLDSVMRSFEEEIATALPSDPVPVSTPDRNPHQPDLGFLLEASDDELGIPPPEISGGGVADVAASAGDGGGEPAEAVGFAKVWGLEEFYLDFGLGPDDNGVLFDEALFEFDDGNCGATEFSDLTWRPEFLPAV